MCKAGEAEATPTGPYVHTTFIKDSVVVTVVAVWYGISAGDLVFKFVVEKSHIGAEATVVIEISRHLIVDAGLGFEIWRTHEWHYALAAEAGNARIPLLGFRSEEHTSELQS